MTMNKPWNYHNIAVDPVVYAKFAEIQTSMGSPKSSVVLQRLIDVYKTFKIKPKCPVCGRLVRIEGDQRTCSKCGKLG